MGMASRSGKKSVSADPHLQAVPDPPSSESGGRGGGGSGFESRLTKLETHLQYLATKEDLQKLKVWWLCGIITGMVTGMGLAAAVALAVLRIFA